MNIDKYKQMVIGLFRSGKATDEQWVEMSEAVLVASENSEYMTETIDDAIIGPKVKCSECGELCRPDESCCS